ncbi:hypothetical protein Tco_1389601 [Tanacetum coccineum]
MMVVVVVELLFSWCGGCGEEIQAEWGWCWLSGDDVVLCVGWGGGEGGGGDRGGVRVAMLWLWHLWGVAWDGSGSGVGWGGGNGGGGRRRRQICQERGG